MWKVAPTFPLCLLALFLILCIGTSVDAISCQVCNSNANKTCGEKLTADFKKTCASNAIGCRKAIIEDQFYGTLVVRSCYNNTYTNHSVHFGNYTRNSCIESRDLLVCICNTDNCNGVSSPWQPSNSTFILFVGIFITLKLFS
ncbi:uncharacterized protein LOC111115811 [Crassostrea virginica]|uniref:Uncharacterized protein LOC111115811 n=1 Tax=Crassostrea virginica TaxID=6565 RepID=A0A8B8C3W3_CRAVI|nr:uncharacterized protein LOC111115811 [Crassostrea virginica]